MSDPFQPARAALAAALLQLGPDHSHAERIRKADGRLIPPTASLLSPDYDGTGDAACGEIDTIIGELSKLTTIPKATAKPRQKMRQAAKPSLPSNVKEAIRHLKAARVHLMCEDE